jgi:hypothetical protein
VPLYGCDRCGFTSAAFRPDAVAAHRLEYPDCDGAMRIMFRSADRHRGGYDRRDRASPARARDAQAEAAATHSSRALLVGERLDAGGMLRLTLLGDLDVAGAEALNPRLAELKTAGRPIRLDVRKGQSPCPGLLSAVLLLLPRSDSAAAHGPRSASRCR